MATRDHSVIYFLMFPSPYGEVGFDQDSDTDEYARQTSRFRSLTGKLVLIGLSFSENGKQEGVKFPSPYGEVGFDRAFGDYDLTSDILVVSVPLRGSWF